MYRATLAFGTFNGPDDAAISEAQLRIILDAWVRCDELELRYYPRIPDLYSSGIVYHLDDDENDDDWCDVLRTIDHGGGDCEDLVCWYTAECRVRKGLPAIADLKRGFFDEYVEGRGIVTMDRIHVFTRIAPCPSYPQGAIVDPSRDLGMNVRVPTANPALARPADWSRDQAVSRIAGRFSRQLARWYDDR